MDFPETFGVEFPFPKNASFWASFWGVPKMGTVFSVAAPGTDTLEATTLAALGWQRLVH